MSLPIETFFMSANHKGTLQSQVQQMIAHGILSGRFGCGEKLPSTRKLATHLGSSRITVTLAYTDLVAADYLTSRGRSGYFVSPDAPHPPNFQNAQGAEDKIDWSRSIAHRFSETAQLSKPSDWARFKHPFIYGQADPELFDHANWRLCAIQALGQRDFGPLTTDYFDQDDPQLIEFIVRHTLPRRGIVAKPSEVLITMGAQNALWLAASVLLTQRRSAAFEDPCYPALRGVLQQARCGLLPVSVDRDGLPPDGISKRADVVFTTPSHQSPTTATMPLGRRRALLDRAEEIDALIVEDDYEFEMSFLRAPLPALKSLDRVGRVIYVGSFSKSIFPGLRLGYLLGSAASLREARALRASELRHAPGHIQRTAAYFLSLGHYDTQIRRTARILQTRRDAMQEAFSRHNLTVAGQGAMGGSSFWMKAPNGTNTADLAARLQEKSVLIEPGHAFFHGRDAPQNFYRLAYSSIPLARIEDGIALIAETLHG